MELYSSSSTQKLPIQKLLRSFAAIPCSFRIAASGIAVSAVLGSSLVVAETSPAAAWPARVEQGSYPFPAQPSATSFSITIGNSAPTVTSVDPATGLPCPPRTFAPSGSGVSYSSGYSYNSSYPPGYGYSSPRSSPSHRTTYTTTTYSTNGTETYGAGTYGAGTYGRSPRYINNSVLYNPTIINGQIRNSTLINPTIITPHQPARAIESHTTQGVSTYHLSPYH